MTHRDYVLSMSVAELAAFVENVGGVVFTLDEKRDPSQRYACSFGDEPESTGPTRIDALINAVAVKLERDEEEIDRAP